MTTRRTFLTALSALYPLSFLGTVPAKGQSFYKQPVIFKRDYFKEIGVMPFINAAGNLSAFGGARMRPEVAEAIRYGTYNKVKVEDLHDSVGKRIAELAETEAAMVTSGAAASMVLATAACMTMGDLEKIEQLPDTTGLKSEIIILKKHRYTYDRALIVAGAKLIEVDNEEELRKAIGPKTAMMFVLLATNDGDSMPMDRFLAVAKEHNIPTFLDGATMTPPASNVIDACKLGFDLVGFSGGKGIRGPYSAGLLLGRKDLIIAAKANNAPNSRALGRGMKVAPEEYIGMMVAFETALKIDEQEDFNHKRQIFDRMMAQIKDIPHIELNVFIEEGMVNEVYLDIDWDRARIKMTNEEFEIALKNGTPSIRIRMMKFSKGRIHLSSTVLADGEEIIIGKRINQILASRA
ncbi:MAG: aminotransferase class V-fold PLP-dependent enzyme [Proteobacteria bacterium]|jgi:uncharacterized pyridoxal phosphate-dependent enzyme|nr:aminotransferase class V-fold PLP-dependent enzyme [Pseudomonadota bacterium]